MGKTLLDKLLVLTVISFLYQSSEAMIPLEDFFPFGNENSDITLISSNMDDGSSPQIQLSIGFPFFDFLHNSLWVNINGAISLVNPISSFSPVCTPVPHTFRMIAPYWGDVDLRMSGQIFYRESFNTTLLNKATEEIKQAFHQFNNIQIKWLFIATWHEVAFYGAQSCLSPSRNTFQSILASDGVNSFVIFNYNAITWTTGRLTSGDCDGLGGMPAKIGFDAGNGETLYTIPDSCTDEIINVKNTTNVGIPGKWIFRVDNAKIESAGCEEAFTGLIRIAPAIIDSYGHVPIEITGPCIDNTKAVYCIFHDPIKGVVEVEGEVVGKDTDMKVVCNAPFIYSGGRIDIDLVMLINETKSMYSGFLYVIEPQPNQHELQVSVISKSAVEVELNFSWETTDFHESNLDIFLYVYDQSIPEWVKTNSVVMNISNTPSFSKLFTKNDLPNDIYKSPFTFSVQPTQHFKDQHLSKDLALNLYKFARINAYVHAAFSLLWSDLHVSCKVWHYKDSGPPNDLLPCPPTKVQALEDPRFITDKACSSPPCAFHPGADICVRSINPSSSHGGQQCCYKGNNILLGPPGGGTVDKCHESINFHLCHFTEDVIPWILCCYESSNELCNLYYDKRPSDPGTKYIPPWPAMGQGDPHITTFDHLDYTFNGAGEFWMVKSNQYLPFSMQSRMEKFIYPDGMSGNATVFTGFVMKSDNSSIVQIQRSVVRTIDIYVDKFQLDLNDPHIYHLTFKNVDVSIANDLSSVSVSFPEGFNIRISTMSEGFSHFTTIDQKYKNKATGLLGNYDGIKENDFQDQSGNVIPINSNLSDIHYKFGLKWQISKNESMFTYIGKQYEDYNDIKFVPNFHQPDIDTAPQEAIDLCGAETSCLFDYMTTGSEKLANQTKSEFDKFNKTVEIYETLIIQCPDLMHPINGFYQTDNFMPGSKASFSCNTGFDLIGNGVIFCNQSTMSWNDSNPSCAQRVIPTTLSTLTTIKKIEITPEKPTSNDTTTVTTISNITSTLTITSTTVETTTSNGNITTVQKALFNNLFFYCILIVLKYLFYN